MGVRHELHQPGALATVRYVESLVEQGDVAADGRLPTERALSEIVGCSRADVRRGLAHLEAAGRVTRHVGRGTYLAAPAADAVAHGATSPSDLMVARMRWEPQVVDLAVLNAKQSDLAEMRRCLDGGDRASTYEDFEAWDLALHRSFATATHNDVVMQMVEILHTSRNDPLWGGMKRRSFSTASAAEYREQHRAIVEAVVDRDRVQAMAAMTDHLAAVRARLLG